MCCHFHAQSCLQWVSCHNHTLCFQVVFCTVLGHIMATFYIFLIFFSCSGWSVIWQSLCFSTNPLVTSPSLLPGCLLLFLCSIPLLLALFQSLLSFVQSCNDLTGLSPSLPSQPIISSMLNHPCCPLVHPWLSPLPVMLKNQPHVFQMFQDVCRAYCKCLSSSPST